MSSHALDSKGRHLAIVDQMLFYDPTGYSQWWDRTAFFKMGCAYVQV